MPRSEEYVKGAAYHEAAHIVIAAVQDLPLSADGLRIDERGAGLADYRMKKPDGSINIGPDPERERTIMATMAGRIAHVIFIQTRKPVLLIFRKT